MNEFDDLLKRMLGDRMPEQPSANDPESWLINAADAVIARRAANDGASLTATERAIYCLWVIDYAARNSGTLEPMRELHPAAAAELEAFARDHRLAGLAAWAASTKRESTFCRRYHDTFAAACEELRAHVAAE